MAFKIARYVQQPNRNFISTPKIRFPVDFIRCVSAASADSHRFLLLPLRSPKRSYRNLSSSPGVEEQLLPTVQKREMKGKASVSGASPEQDQKGSKWEGKTSALVVGISADTVWHLLEDFCSINKWVPNLESTRLVEGQPGQLGCIRHSTGPPLPGATIGSFTYEKLVAFDPARRTLSYEVLDNNIGFGYFVGTLAVVPGGDDGCTIEWSFMADPMTAWTEKEIQAYVGFEVQTMAKRMAEALQAD